ncbi:beta-lactamase [Bombardia bombarda]|uniref:Beta-lactamase n=1 Tax=Bombardia bombarda TaxID=252184 RepID=A0AA40CDR2_9PEZI|nr:beta-lactamase [Bombardia bombarda]
MAAPFSALEASVAQGVQDGILPGAVFFAKDKSGKLDYASAVGHASLATKAPMKTDTMLALASMTKLLTSIAAVQLVERGLITLDTDVSPYLPGLAAQPVITSSSPQVTLTPRTKPILLRHLLTHSSGCGYRFIQPPIAAWVQQHYGAPNPPPSAEDPPTVDNHVNWPLLFEPGTGWAYGSGIDWAGKLVEVLSGLDLESYFQQHILAPLGIPLESITFYPERHESLDKTRLAGMTSRNPATGRVEHFDMGKKPAERAAYGGEGATADLGEYIKVMYSLLVDDGKLLKPETARLVFRPWLKEPEAKEALSKEIPAPWVVGVVPDTGEYDWGLAGLLVDGDKHEYRKSGTLLWGGMFNLTWFIDRTAGVCGVFGTQLMQPGDPQVEVYIKAFEDEIYRQIA